MAGTTAAVILIGALVAGLLAVPRTRSLIRCHRDGALLLLVVAVLILALIEAAKLL